jgi:uncharacterized protein (DUF1501 family)
VGMGGGVPMSLRGTGALSALALESIDSFHLEGRGDARPQIASALQSMYSITSPRNLLDSQAKLMFETIDMLKELSATEYKPPNGAEYPDNGFGMGLQQVAQLIRAEVGLEAACVDIDGWDTHETQGTLDGTFNKLLSTFAQGIAAFMKDIGAKLDTTTIVTMSEFGRRVEENASKGCDHGHGNVMFVAGGGVNGGKVYGTWPTLAEDKLDDGDLAVTTDQRDVLAEIVSLRLLNPALPQIFPGYTPKPLGLMQPRV